MGMKALIWTMTAGAVISGAATVQAEEKIDLEARKRSVAVVNQHIAEREARRDELVTDIKALNTRLETNIDRVVEKLASIKDSPTSGFRVNQIKVKAMKGLGRVIEDYQSRRSSVIREIREGRSGVPKETLEKDAAIFDDYIEKRVQQIMKISKSFTQDDESIEKYEKVDVEEYYTPGLGWSDEIEQISEEWKQNNRDKSQDKVQRSEILEALKKSIERYSSLVAAKQDSLANRKMSAADRELMKSELLREQAVLESRNEELRQLLEVSRPNTDAVDGDEALHLAHTFEDMTEDMRSDFDAIFAKYAELNKERANIARLTKNRDARVKWIEEYEAKGGN
jgi:hypothetical protein